MLLMGTDLGQGNIKAIASNGREVVFPHALMGLPESDYARLVERGTGFSNSEVVRVNGLAYAYGETAEALGSAVHRLGADRYRPGYYGTLLGITMALAGGYEATEFAVMASFPPRDEMYRDEILHLYDDPGSFHIEMAGETYQYSLRYINAVDEPLGGYAHALFDDEALRTRSQTLLQGRTLVVDVGFGTSDFYSVGPGGKPDGSIRTSVTVGMGKALDRFHDAVRRRYPDAWRSGHDILPETLRTGMRTGQIPYAGRTLDVLSEADDAAMPVLAQLRDAFWLHAGGPANWDCILQTGGGPAALGNRLVDLWEHDNVVNADQNLDVLERANARGLLKLLRLYQRQGW